MQKIKKWNEKIEKKRHCFHWAIKKKITNIRKWLGIVYLLFGANVNEWIGKIEIGFEHCLFFGNGKILQEMFFSQIWWNFEGNERIKR